MCSVGLFDVPIWCTYIDYWFIRIRTGVKEVVYVPLIYRIISNYFPKTKFSEKHMQNLNKTKFDLQYSILEWEVHRQNIYLSNVPFFKTRYSFYFETSKHLFHNYPIEVLIRNRSAEIWIGKSIVYQQKLYWWKLKDPKLRL